ncbi:MAG: transcription termination factor NusA [Bryobacteraceae bacterium]|nr:transcription termination factor NusA [Bryobacteraceae bacterium]
MASIYQSIEILSKEKGIDRQIILDAVKDAMVLAAKKHFKTNEDLEAEFDPKSGAVQIFLLKKVVENVEDPLNEVTLDQARKLDKNAAVDTTLRISKPTDALGRIAAQMAKQVILQKVREAERENVYVEFADRVGELVNCVVKRIEGPDLVVDMGKTEARIPKKEQSRLESFSVGERVRAVIKAVDKTGKNAGVLISRADASLVQRLFEQEVPEIYDGTVVIRACAREAGERTKIAVQSRDRDVDSVGACVGMKGMRVQSIIRELRGEKIDIIEYSEEPVTFATHALSPAKISRVNLVDVENKHMEVIVDDTQLSLAIGKRGQNVRLAAKLLGWKIDIKSEEEKRQEAESALNAITIAGAPVSVLLDHGLNDSLVESLMANGVPTVERLGSMTPEELMAIEGVDQDGLEKIGAAVNGYYSQYDQPEAEAAPIQETEQETVGETTGEPVAESETAQPAAESIEVVEHESATIENAETEPIS